MTFSELIRIHREELKSNDKRRRAPIAAKRQIYTDWASI